jgi:hypothetical protein
MRVREMEKFHSAIVGALLLLLTIIRASAEVNQAEARRCSIIVDDEKRLRCFDDLFSTKPKARDSARDPGGWSVIEGKSTADGRLQFSGALVVATPRSSCAAGNKRRRQPSQRKKLIWAKKRLASGTDLISRSRSRRCGVLP